MRNKLFALFVCEHGAKCGPDAPFMPDDCRRRNLCMNGETVASLLQPISDLFARSRAASRRAERP